MTKDADRILTLEINFKNFMDNVEEKFSTIIQKIDDMPKLYAGKTEFKLLCEKVESMESSSQKTKLARIKNRGAIAVALISSATAIIAVLK